MTISEISQVLTSIAAIGGLIVSVLNRRKIETVHRATNSMKDELVALTAKSSHAEGVKEEKDRVK
jgi:hypothetical protein